MDQISNVYQKDFGKDSSEALNRVGERALLFHRETPPFPIQFDARGLSSVAKRLTGMHQPRRQSAKAGACPTANRQQSFTEHSGGAIW